jgi:hypothetical protein
MIDLEKRIEKQKIVIKAMQQGRQLERDERAYRGSERKNSVDD